MTARERLLADLADTIRALRGAAEGVLRPAQIIAQQRLQRATHQRILAGVGRFL